MYKGSCLCGAVRYQASELVGPYVYCHCQSCRKSSGTAFAANISAPIESFEVVSGDDFIKVFESSPKKYRHFCSNCGSPVFTKVGDDAEVVRLRLGSLDTPFDEKLSAHIFVAHKATWHEPSDSVPQYSHWPDKGALAIPGSRQQED